MTAKPLRSIDELAAYLTREMRTLALLEKPITFALPAAHVVPLERLVVSALLDGWAQLGDFAGLEPEHFADRLLAHLFVFLRTAREEGVTYSDGSIAQAFERLGFCHAERMKEQLVQLRYWTPTATGLQLRDAAAQIAAVARWRAFAAEVAKTDALLRHAANVGETLDVEAALGAARDALAAADERDQ